MPTKLEHRTTVRLDSQDDRLLAHLVQKTGQTKSEIVRAALRAAAVDHFETQEKFTLVGRMATRLFRR